LLKRGGHLFAKVAIAVRKKARRVCAWESLLFPPGLPEYFRRVIPGQTDLFLEKGCQPTKPGNRDFRPEFVRRAAAFTTANV
jgi:hypothetical protein